MGNGNGNGIGNGNGNANGDRLNEPGRQNRVGLRGNRPGKVEGGGIPINAAHAKGQFYPEHERETSL